MTVSKFLALVFFALVLAACSDKKSEEQPAPKADSAPAAAPAKTSEPAAAPAVEHEPKEVQRVVYDCGGGKNISLRLFDDQRARVDIEGRTEVLRPVETQDGTLFLGDNVNVRVIGQQAIASRAGIVLLSGCKTQPTP